MIERAIGIMRANRHVGTQNFVCRQLVRRLQAMPEYELTVEDFTSLVKAASRHHREQIAGWLALTAHADHGSCCFRGDDGAEVPLAEVHRRSQANDRIRRWAYNLFMYYAHFGHPACHLRKYCLRTAPRPSSYLSEGQLVPRDGGRPGLALLIKSM